ncbi:putative phage lysin [Carnobacterium maltaromaticum]|uniref:GH25 family lysozyme n=1 Tax=Carnobacterium maltaromaticum TaxID=2751 RepID=UPI00191B9211|nr:GH25 family lysozyme [Carnobacterium maltaromaticum]CAD5900132.1 putative phage lysin [Carnobacterium maltaromaticum]CAD5902638.1 putative phage lysin [Carnobacterium maltaromaticum]
MKKKWIAILGLALAMSVIGSMEAKAMSKNNSKDVNMIQPKSQLEANVIDISSHQKAADIDFEKWKEQGIEAVVIKLTEGMEDGAPYYNPEAEAQIEKALEAGLKVNFYHYSWMTSIENAIEEADWFTKIADKYSIPKDSVMALDLENSLLTYDPIELTNQANAFFDRMIENGYPKIDVYASISWFGTRFITEELRTDNYWVASWSEEKPEIVTGMWQFTNNYRLEGYNGPLDGNIDFTGYYTQ